MNERIILLEPNKEEKVWLERRQYYEDIKILSNKRIYSGGGY